MRDLPQRVIDESLKAVGLSSRVSLLVNQVYASRAGQVVTVKYVDRSAGKRENDAFEYTFEVSIDGEVHQAAVGISRDASSDIGRLVGATSMLGAAGDKCAHPWAVDFCTALILQVIDAGANFGEVAQDSSNTFIRLSNREVADLLKEQKVSSSEIKEYVTRRLHAAWDVGTGMIDWAQFFGRVDQLYLGLRERDFMKVIMAYNGQLWQMHAEHPLLTPTDQLTRTFVGGDETGASGLQRRPAVEPPFQQEGSAALRRLVGRVATTEERDFLDEAIKCYEVQAYRAAMVMVWILALDHLQEFILRHHLGSFNIELAKVKDKRVKVSTINSKDDFGDIPENKFIEVARAASIISNDVRKILDGKLGIRNSYAHPSNISLSPAKAADFIADLTDNVVLKYPL